jgi:hypothetical protein
MGNEGIVGSVTSDHVATIAFDTIVAFQIASFQTIFHSKVPKKTQESTLENCCFFITDDY